MSFTTALIISGYDTIGNQEISLVTYASLYNYFLSDKINVEYCNVKTQYEMSNYLRGYSFEDYNIVYLIYVGHGQGVNDYEYPYISPFEDIDIMNLNIKNKSDTKIRFRIIYNCCNINNIELNITDKSAIEITNIDKFLSMEFEYLCIRKGLVDSAYSNRTRFGDSIFNTLINYKFDTTEEFLGILNVNFGRSYKNNKNITNGRIKKFISCSVKFPIINESTVKGLQISEIPLPTNYIIEDTNCKKRYYIDYHSIHNDNIDIFGGILSQISL
jgi:hypothetical protein